jgi:putative transposase
MRWLKASSRQLKLNGFIRNNYINQEQAQLSIFEWIESWYIRRRRHSAIGYKTIGEREINNYKFYNAA